MKIRCNNCYRVLNNNEEYCTKCGTHSEEIQRIMETGEIPVDETGLFKLHIYLYLGIAFLLNGGLFVLYGVFFDKLKPGEYGEIGDPMPKDITYFSSINALLITSLIMFLLILLINAKNIFVDYKITEKKRAFISAIIMSIIGVGLIFLTKETPISVIPLYMKEYIQGTIADADLFMNSISMWKIILILMTYSVVQEYVFRKHLFGAIDESTLLSTPATFILMTIVGAVLDIACFSLFSSGTVISLIYIFIGSLIYQGVLNLNYFYNKQSMLSNIVFRILLIIGLVIFL
ncbi:MAG: hypothetical protein IJX78_07875 [Bacilli bacterium]|nr:hypothetical protein [Bacilli bacterium]